MEAGGGGDAPGHGGGVVGEAEAAIGAEEDDSAVAAEAVVEVGDGFAGGDFWGGAGGDAVSGPFAEDELHDGFSPAGEGDGGGEIVCIAAATDEGRVADAAGGLVEGAAGGGGSGEVAVGVEGYGADGVVGVHVRVEGGLGVLVVAKDLAGEGFVGEAGGLAGLCVFEAFAFAIEDQLGVVDEGHAMGVGKALRAFPDKVDVRRLLQDEAGGLDGVAEAFDAGYAAGLHASAVHEQGIELDTAIGGEKAAAAGVECGVIFQDGDGSFNGMEGRAAVGEDGLARFEGGADTGFVGGCRFGWDGPSTAVDEESGRVDARGCHGDMVADWCGAAFGGDL